MLDEPFVGGGLEAFLCGHCHLFIEVGRLTARKLTGTDAEYQQIACPACGTMHGIQRVEKKVGFLRVSVDTLYSTQSSPLLQQDDAPTHEWTSWPKPPFCAHCNSEIASQQAWPVEGDDCPNCDGESTLTSLYISNP